MRFAFHLLALHAIPVILIVTSASTTLADERLEGIACRSVHLAFQNAAEGVAFYHEVRPEESAEGTYFCVCGFRQGYFGIQEQRRGRKVVIFSVWDPGDQNDPDAVDEEQRVKILHQGEGVRIGRFGNEGTGGQSFFDYDWKTGETYRFGVNATNDGKRTAYAAWFYLPEEARWKHLVTFSTLNEGAPLNGYYAFVEDFRRNRVSATLTRRAHFGNGWVKTLDGRWTPLREAKFTADANPVLNINAGLSAPDGFYLATGGEIENEDVSLGDIMKREPAPQSFPPDFPETQTGDLDATDEGSLSFPFLPDLETSTGALRVVTYNILRGEQTETVAAVINALNADVVALQEVDVRTTRVDGRDVLQELAEMTGRHHAFGKAIDHAGGEYGVGLLSRFPITKHEVHVLPDIDQAEARVALEALVAVPAWPEPLRMLVTHLDAGRDDALRLLQAVKLAELFANDADTPAILAGDLNARPDSAPIRALTASGWVDSVPARSEGERHFTHASDVPNKRIDYIFLSSGKRWETLRASNGLSLHIDHPAWPAALKAASDHLPVVAELRWKGP